MIIPIWTETTADKLVVGNTFKMKGGRKTYKITKIFVMDDDIMFHTDLKKELINKNKLVYCYSEHELKEGENISDYLPKGLNREKEKQLLSILKTENIPTDLALQIIPAIGTKQSTKKQFCLISDCYEVTNVPTDGFVEVVYKRNKERRFIKVKDIFSNSYEAIVSIYFYDLFLPYRLSNNKFLNTSNIFTWIKSVEKLLKVGTSKIEINNRTKEDIKKIYLYLKDANTWWIENSIFSISGLEENYDTIYSQMTKKYVPKQKEKVKEKKSLEQSFEDDNSLIIEPIQPVQPNELTFEPIDFNKSTQAFLDFKEK